MFSANLNMDYDLQNRQQLILLSIEDQVFCSVNANRLRENATYTLIGTEVQGPALVGGAESSVLNPTGMTWRQRGEARRKSPPYFLHMA